MSTYPSIPSAYWQYLLETMSGSARPVDHDDQEQMKALASVARSARPEPMHASFRVPYWLLHAASH